MITLTTLAISTAVSFLAHHFTERFLARYWTKNLQLRIKGYQIHHSFFGALAIILAFLLAGGVYFFAMLGYGLGNIWQHKRTHNQINEKGLVFISRIAAPK